MQERPAGQVPAMTIAARGNPHLNRAAPGAAHRAFRKAVDAEAGCKGAGEALLRIFGIPPDLSCLEDGLIRTREILALNGKTFDRCSTDVSGGCRSRDLVDWIDAAVGVLRMGALNGASGEAMRAEMGRIHEDAPHPLRGYCFNVCHHWVNLFYEAQQPLDPEQVTPQRGYRSIVRATSAYVLAAFHRIPVGRYTDYVIEWEAGGRQPRRELFPEGQLTARVAVTSRSLRRLGLLRHRVGLKCLVDAFQETRSLREALNRCTEFPIVPLEDLELFNQFGLLIALLDPDHPGRSRSAGRSGGLRGSVRSSLPDGYVRIAHSGLLLSPLRVELVGTREVIQRGSDGGPSDDDEDTPTFDRLHGNPWELLTEEDDGGIDRGAATSARMIRSAWAADQVRRSDFAHKLAWPALTAREMTQLRSLLAIPMHELDELERHMTVELSVILATGRSHGVARNLPIRSRSGTADDPRMEYDLDAGTWVLPAPPPAYEHEEFVEGERPIETELYLPDPFRLWEYLRQPGVVAHQRLAIRRGHAPKRQSVERFLMQRCGRRVRLAMVEGFLFRALLEHSSGDVALAAMLTGRSHSHSASARHYSHYPGARLRALHRDALAPLVEADVETMGEAGEAGEAGGARRVPTPDKVRELLGCLRDRLLNGDTWRTCHNAYNTYLMAGLTLAVGYRPVANPAPLAWDPETELISYADKAPTDYHRRISALPPVYARQLRRHVDYVARMRAAWNLPGSGEPVNFFWFDGDEAPPQPYRPGALETVVPDYRLGLYSLRRFMRTMLIARGDVAVEDVDAWMGHWFHRMSPHDEFSTYPLRRLRSLALGPVTAILQTVGYEVLEPPAVPHG